MHHTLLPTELHDLGFAQGLDQEGLQLMHYAQHCSGRKQLTTQ